MRQSSNGSGRVDGAVFHGDDLTFANGLQVITEQSPIGSSVDDV